MITYITWSVITIGVLGGSLLIWCAFWWGEYVRPLIIDGMRTEEEINFEMLRIGTMRLRGEDPTELLEGVEARYQHLNKVVLRLEELHTTTITGRIMKYVLRKVEND